MKNNVVDVLGIQFINTTFEGMVSTLHKRIEDQTKTFVVTANPEIVMYTYEDPQYKEIIHSADYVTPDGVGVILGAKILKTPLQERVTGFDTTIRLLELANEHSWKVYLLGGKEDINEKAAHNIKEKYPNLSLVGHHHGYFQWEDAAIPREIKALEPDIVLVALGFPRQEKWIKEHYASFSKGIFIGVGGSIDVLSGEVKRAPEFWQKTKLEWFYRLIKQPSRWKRMMALPKFVIEVIKVRFSKRRG